MLQVIKSRCQNCLFEKDRIVSPERAKEIIKECISAETHFICHCSTMLNSGNVCCRGFYDIHGDEIRKIQIAKKLNLLEFVELPETEKLPPFRDYS